MKNFKYKSVLWLTMLLVMAVTGWTAAQAQDLEPYRDWFGSYGYVDTAGSIVIECRFDDAKAFSEGRAAVLSRGGDISGVSPAEATSREKEYSARSPSPSSGATSTHPA